MQVPLLLCHCYIAGRCMRPHTSHTMQRYVQKSTDSIVILQRCRRGKVWCLFAHYYRYRHKLHHRTVDNWDWDWDAKRQLWKLKTHTHTHTRYRRTSPILKMAKCIIIAFTISRVTLEPVQNFLSRRVGILNSLHAHIDSFWSAIEWKLMRFFRDFRCLRTIVFFPPLWLTIFFWLATNPMYSQCR